MSGVTADPSERRRATSLVRVLTRPFAASDPDCPTHLKRRFSLRVALPVALGALLLCLPVGGFGIWATIRVDTRNAEREGALLAAALDRTIAQVAREQEGAVISDEAAARTRDGDYGWVAYHLGQALAEAHGHNRTYVLDPMGRVFLAVREGYASPTTAFDRDAEDLAPLLAEVRAIAGDASRPAAEAAAWDVLVVDGVASIVSVRAITPSSFRVRLLRGQEFLHVTLRHIDADFLGRIGDALLLPGLASASAAPADAGPLREPGRRFIDVRDRSGSVVERVSWTPSRPGAQLVQDALPGLTGSGALVLLLVAVLWRGLLETVGRLHVSEQRATRAALHDALTGLPNRVYFGRRLDGVRDAGRDADRGVAVHYVDLDGFKEVNDTLGHPAGDALICMVAERLRAIAAPGDTVARLGGDEFALLQTNLRGAQEADELARRIIAAMEPPFAVDGKETDIGCSVGIAIGTGWGVTPQEIMRRADVALYQAKGAGRGRHCFFDRSFDDGMRERRALELSLREALDGKAGLHVAYQPIFDCRGTRVLGAEALVRWRHPERGPVSPGDFLPVAEERGLMARLGAFVLEEACQAAVRAGLPWVAVNVSASEVRAPGFADSVLGHLDRHGLAPQRLQVEITESLLLDASATVANAILKLRLAGVKVSLDDFGTGFSSLGYLTRLQVDKIKIDRSFVRGLGTDGQAEAIVKAMVDLARALQLDVTAEGVETECERAVLDRLGSPEIQGFLFSKPLAEADLAALIARGAAPGARAPARRAGQGTGAKPSMGVAATAEARAMKPSA